MSVIKTLGIGNLGLGHIGRSAGMSSFTDNQPQYRIFESETGVLWRQGIRDGYIVLDYALTPLAFSGAENTDWVNEERTPYLPIPTGLAVEFDGDGFAVLTWVSDYDVYIERSATDETNYTFLATVSAGLLTYTDEIVDSDTDYYYRIKAVVGDITGPFGIGLLLISYWTPRTISALAITVDSDVQFTLNWTNDGVADYTGHKAYISTDNINFTLNKTVASIETSMVLTGLTTNTRYYVKVAPYRGINIGTQSASANDWTAAKIPLAATGTGAGVATIVLQFGTTDVIVTLDGNGKFYSDSGGTANESASYTFVAGALRTRYLKVTSGNSNMLVFAKGNWLRWGDSTADGWVSSTNAPTTSVAITALPSTIIHFNIGGNNTISGSITSRTNLIHLRLTGSNTISGVVTNMTSIQVLRVVGSNTLSGLLTNLTSLTDMYIGGSNTVSGDIGVNNAVNGCLTIYLVPCQMDTYTSGAVWSNGNITINPSVSYGYSSAEIDAMLIDMAASPTLISKTITLQGSSAARTAASNAAVATLTGVGRTCTVVTNP